MFLWNLFDVVCVLFTVTDLVADLIGAAIPSVFSQGYLRLLRICRVVRVLRLVKLVRFLSGVRKLLIAVHGALTTLLWAVVLLVILMYVFTITMSTLMIQYYEELDPKKTTDHSGIDLGNSRTHTERVQHLYGSVMSSMQTLFMSISGGDWTVLSEPITVISWPIKILWYLYVTFVIFGLLNVFTGIFVESATHAANADREILMQAEIEEENSYINQIRALFVASGHDVKSSVTEQELKALMMQPQFRSQLGALGLHTTEAHGLFQLLDGDNSGKVSIDEFLSGILRLKGTAKAVDMVTLLFETSKMQRKMTSIERILLGDRPRGYLSDTLGESNGSPNSKGDATAEMAQSP